MFDAQRARQLGLVSELASPEQLDARIARFIDELLLAGPRALLEAKRLVAGLAAQPPGEELGEATSELIARLRVSPEGQEGLQAFLERRPPGWRG